MEKMKKKNERKTRISLPTEALQIIAFKIAAVAMFKNVNMISVNTTPWNVDDTRPGAQHFW